MGRTIGCIVALQWAAVLWADELPPPSGDVFVPGAKLEKLFTRTAPIRGGLTEGPACAPDGSIYFSDIPMGPDKGQILRFDPRTGMTTVFAENSRKSNGLFFDAQGHLVACEGADGGGKAVVRWNIKTKERTVLADRFMGKRFNAPNDLTIDRKGRIYFTDPQYVGGEPREIEHFAVYRIDPDGQVHEVTRETEKPNGIGLSPDQRTLYVVDHNNDPPPGSTDPKQRGAMKLYAFPLNDAGFVSGSRRVLYDLGQENGFDGMALDEQGNLYLAQRSLRRPGILVLNPDGKEIGFLPTGPSQPGATQPVGLPSNCCFGAGEEKSTLYITVDVSLYRIRTKHRGAPHAWEK
ncbi:MAG: SMP-30/gluconolactonase/LRE family protein [Gemmataceae bacterium]|nr:SMP-30/gluconolactonase/LRE family protein [Gemmataceae bacterium]